MKMTVGISHILSKFSGSFRTVVIPDKVEVAFALGQDSILSWHRIAS